MESFWRKSPPEPGISVKSEIEFDFESNPEYDIIENQIELDNMTEGELKAEVQDMQKAEIQARSELQADIWIKGKLEADAGMKNEPESDAVIWIKGEPDADVGIKNEPEGDIVIKMECENDPETELEFGVGTKCYDSLVRIFLVHNLNFAEYLYPLKLTFLDVLQ